MASFEVMITRTIEQAENMMKGRSPEFYNNVGMTLGGLIIWNFSLILGMFINYNKHALDGIFDDKYVYDMSVSSFGSRDISIFWKIEWMVAGCRRSEKSICFTVGKFEKSYRLEMKEDIKENYIDLSSDEEDDKTKKDN